MISDPLNSFYTAIVSASEKKGYLPKLVFFCIACVLFFAAPRLFTQGMELFDTEWWQVVVRKSNDLTDNLSDIDPSHHAAKKVFRLTVPFIAMVLHLNPLGIYLVQFLAGSILLAIIYKLILRDSKDSVVATLIVLGTTFVYFGKACFVDVLSTFDGFSFLFIVLAMYARKTPWIFLFSLMAAWNDERAFISLLLVFLYHQHKVVNEFKFNFNKATIALFMVAVTYLTSRLLLSNFANMHTPTGGVGTDVFFYNIPNLGLGIWTSFEGYWILILLFLFILYNQRKKLLFFFYLLLILCFMLLGLLVFDITRGETYLFPLLFVIIPFVKEAFTKNQMRDVILFCTIINFIFPAHFIMGSGLNMYQPIYFDLLYYIRNHIYQL